MIKSRLLGIATGLLISISASSAAYSTDLPLDDPGLFSYLFTQKSIPADWISEPANEELTPAMMKEIAEKLSSEGGEYQEATKTAPRLDAGISKWLCPGENRSRHRSQDRWRVLQQTRIT